MRYARPHPGGIGLFFGLLVLIAILLVVAWARGWLSMSVVHRDSEQIQVQVTVDKDRVGEDAEKFASEARQLGESASVATQIRSVEGTLTEISEADDQMTIRTSDDTTMTLRLDPSVQVVADGRDAGRDQLVAGRQAVVTYREADGAKWALKITLDEPRIIDPPRGT